MHVISKEETIERCFATFEDGKIYKSVMNDTEKILIEKALARCAGNQLVASRVLGLNRNTLRSKIRKFNIDMGKFKK